MKRISKVGLMVGGLALAGSGLTFANASIPNASGSVGTCMFPSGVGYIVDKDQVSSTDCHNWGGTSGSWQAGLPSQPVYENGSSQLVGPGEDKVITSHCGDASDWVTGGGNWIEGVGAMGASPAGLPSGDHIYVEESKYLLGGEGPSPDGRQGWQVRVFAPTSNTHDLLVFAFANCLRPH